MATPAQITANQLNAQSSSGPKSPEGKARCASNASIFGLFSQRHHVAPEETEAYRQLSNTLICDLQPKAGMEDMYATEIIRLSWRLRRCNIVEERLADIAAAKNEVETDAMQDPETRDTQLAVDRARSHCANLLRRATTELRRLQTERRLRAEELECNPGRVNFGLSDTAILIKTVEQDAHAQLAKAAARKTKYHSQPISAPAVDYTDWIYNRITNKPNPRRDRNSRRRKLQNRPNFSSPLPTK